MMEEKTHNTVFISIVAIVAIVALVVLIQGNGAQKYVETSDSDSVNLHGQAVRFSTAKSENIRDSGFENYNNTNNTNQTNNTVVCSDSDSGFVIEIKGFLESIANGTVYHGSDYCLSNSTLNEFYCNENSTTGYSVSAVYCPGYCVDGACTDYTPHNCTDTDSGKNYLKKGSVYADGVHYFTDYCFNTAYVYEGYCGPAGSVHAFIAPCPESSKCVNGFCKYSTPTNSSSVNLSVEKR